MLVSLFLTPFLSKKIASAKVQQKNNAVDLKIKNNSSGIITFFGNTKELEIIVET